MSLRRSVEEGEAATRAALYRGDIFLLEGTPASRRLAEEAFAEVERELGPDPRRAQFRLPPEELFARIGSLRRTLYKGERFTAAARAVMAERGFDPEASAVDPCRLRAIVHDGGRDPKARPIYAAHRDTWYGHPQAQLSWWLPLHDVAEEETFVFYPDRFAEPVSNDSEGFDYDLWTARGQGLRIGWQDPDAGRREFYPGALGAPAPGRVLRFAARAGDLLVFAGAHYHQTLPQHSGRTRFSLDFRTVHLEDQAAGRGAPNVDNRSRGSALRDYARLPEAPPKS